MLAYYLHKLFIFGRVSISKAQILFGRPIPVFGLWRLYTVSTVGSIGRTMDSRTTWRTRRRLETNRRKAKLVAG